MPKLEIDLSNDQFEFVKERGMRTHKLGPQAFIQQTVNEGLANWIEEDNEEKEETNEVQNFFESPQLKGLLGNLVNLSTPAAAAEPQAEAPKVN